MSFELVGIKESRLSDILEWAKLNSREGSNLAEVEEMVSKIDVNQAVTSNDQALDFMQNNNFFKAALDSETSKRVDKYSTETMPKKLELERARIRDEEAAKLNPKETDDQKRIRELEQLVKDSQAKDSNNKLKTDLRAKAKELNFDADKAERYSRFGEDAFSYLEKDASDFSNYITTELDKQIKAKFGDNAPKTTTVKDPALLVNRNDFGAMSPQAKMVFIQKGGIVED